MKSENTKRIEASKKARNAVIWHLMTIMAFGFIMQKIYPVMVAGSPLWAIIAPFLYILLLAYSIKELDVKYKEIEQYDFEQILNEAEDAEERANAKDAEATVKLNEATAKANASEKIAIEVQKLRASEQTLISKLQTLSADLATAMQSLEDAKQTHSDSLQTLKQLHEKATATLLGEKTIAEKTAQSLEKKLNAINQAEEEKAQRKSIKATWSASGKNEAVMAEKFAGLDWQSIVLG
jgi:hypothetical protein